MHRRIAAWALIGVGVACLWVIFSLFVPGTNIAHWNVITVTAPASIFGRSIAMKYYWFVVLNGAIYGLAGVLFESCRRILRH